MLKTIETYLALRRATGFAMLKISKRRTNDRFPVADRRDLYDRHGSQTRPRMAQNCPAVGDVAALNDESALASAYDDVAAAERQTDPAAMPEKIARLSQIQPMLQRHIEVMRGALIVLCRV